MARIQRTSLALILLVSWGAFIGPIQSTLAQQQDPPQALQLNEVAANAQNDGDFETALDKWNQLISDYPKFSQIGKAEFNCGKCYLELQDYPNAIKHFQSATQQLPKKAVMMLPESFLYLGYSQYEYGMQLLDEDPQGNQDQANQYLTTAAQNFSDQLSTYQDFEHNDQVCYFQGMTYEALERLEDAAVSYERMFEIKQDTTFKLDGLFFLGNVYERLGQYDKAMKNYRDFLEVGADNRSFHEVQFRTASTLTQMATAAKEIDNQAEYQAHLNEAEKLFASVAAIDGFDLQNDAQYQRAVCFHRLGQLERAAENYEVLAIGNSPLADRAAVWAGRNYLSTGNTEKAESLLKRIADAKGKLGTEAAHFLAVLKLQTQQPAQAFQLADQWLSSTDRNAPFIAELMQDKADAAFLVSSLREESPNFYLDLYRAFPDHRLTTSALYNAAFAYLETGNLEKAKKTCEEFESKFKNDSYLPDLLEVHADVHLLQKELPQSQALFEQLVRDYANHEKSNTWKIRVGIVRNMQGMHEETIRWLTPLVPQLPTKTQKAEALHWIGSSQLAQENYSQAEESLIQSMREDPKWRLAAQTMFALSNAQQKLNKSADAQQTLTAMKAAFPNAKQGIEADYRAAESAYKSGDYDTALTLYKSIIDHFPNSEYVPYSRYGIAWAQLQSKNYAAAETAFTSFLELHDDTEMAGQALLGRGMSRRQNDNPQGAISDLQAFVKLDGENLQKVEGRYELGLAQTQVKQTQEAIATFRDLIADAPQHKFADRFHYELAWLYIANEEHDKGHDQFVALSEGFPDSDLAPEAHFKVGEKAYKADQFNDAIDAFLQCRNSGGEDSLREKAAYRLGWCYYKQKEYDKAHEMFSQQVEQFENGRYNADAWVMIAESLYNQNMMKEAFEAYRVAKPAIDAGGKVAKKNNWLTMLHGSVSANKIARHQEALAFADQLIESDAADNLKLEGWFEKGMALKGLRQNPSALEAFAKAAESLGEVGAKSRCMIGDLHFVDQQFDKAVDAYKDVFYGYGGNSKDELIDPWQGYAIYHAARCSFVRIQQAKNDSDQPLVDKLVRDATKLYENLLTNYPNDEFAANAQKELETLKQIK